MKLIHLNFLTLQNTPNTVSTNSSKKQGQILKFCHLTNISWGNEVIQWPNFVKFLQRSGLIFTLIETPSLDLSRIIFPLCSNAFSRWKIKYFCLAVDYYEFAGYFPNDDSCSYFQIKIRDSF